MAASPPAPTPIRAAASQPRGKLLARARRKIPVAVIRLIASATRSPKNSVQQPANNDSAKQARSPEHGRAERRITGCNSTVRQQRRKMSDRSIHAGRTHEKDRGDDPKGIRAHGLLPRLSRVSNRRDWTSWSSVAPRSPVYRQLSGKPRSKASSLSHAYDARQRARLTMACAMSGRIMAPRPAPTMTNASAVPKRR
jgi:hypothetical protein